MQINIYFHILFQQRFLPINNLQYKLSHVAVPFLARPFHSEDILVFEFYIIEMVNILELYIEGIIVEMNHRRKPLPSGRARDKAQFVL